MGKLLGVVVSALCGLGPFPAAASAATITVNTPQDQFSVADDGFCSLREAVQSMNIGSDYGANCVATVSPDGYGDNDVIRLPSDSYVLDIDGPGEDMNATGDLDIRSDLNIDRVAGAGADPTINQNFATDDRVIDVPISGVTLGLNNLGVVNGEATASNPGDHGGNIFYRSDEILQLNNVDVLNGLASGPGGGRGGGIAAIGGGSVLVVNGSLIQNNVAGASTGNSYYGGGIYIGGTGTDLSVTDSSISQNKAGVSSGGMAVTGGSGGGIYDGATSSTTLAVSGSAIDANQAGGGAAGVDGFGGAIGVSSGSATVTIGSSTSVSNNDAGGGFAGADGFGGGIYASGGGTSTLSLGNTSVNVTGNDAGGNGSGFSSTGGGIHTEMPTTITGAAIASNDAAADGTSANGGGGGIYMTNSVPAPLTITGSNILGNRAGTTGFGGVGGGILDNNDSPMTISGNRIANNAAIATGGGLYRSPSPLGTPNDSISTSIFTNNTATLGAGIYAFTDGSLSLLRSTVNMNTASGNSQGLGGGLLLDQMGGGATTGDYLIENSTIDNNTAANFGGTGGEGGGVHLRANTANTAPVLTVRSSTISDNTAAVGGTTGLGGNLRASGVTIMDKNLIKLQGSIVTGGVAGVGHENCSAGQTGTFQSLGGNVEGPPSVSPTSQCGLGQPSDVFANPMLGTLMNNGGPMVGQGAGVPLTTRAITSSSSAFNLVPVVLCPPSNIDEIGTTRPQGTACDAGAYEVPDVDGDGVMDSADSCPAQAGPASNAGCPLPVANPPALTPTTPTTPTTPKKKKCKKKKRKGAAAAKKCKKKKKAA